MHPPNFCSKVSLWEQNLIVLYLQARPVVFLTRPELSLLTRVARRLLALFLPTQSPARARMTRLPGDGLDPSEPDQPTGEEWNGWSSETEFWPDIIPVGSSPPAQRTWSQSGEPTALVLMKSKTYLECWVLTLTKQYWPAWVERLFIFRTSGGATIQLVPTLKLCEIYLIWFKL